MVKGKTAYNNGNRIIFLTEDEDIPEGFVRGGLPRMSAERYKQAGKKSSQTQKDAWNNLSQEEKDIRLSSLHDRMFTDEVNAKRAESCRHTMSLKSEEELSAISEKKSESLKRTWATKTSIDKENRRIKTKETCIEKYGVEFPCQLPQCGLSNSGTHTKPNEAFAHLLDKYNLEYEREFPLSKYKYDFKVGNILFEINPTATHNSTYGIYYRDGLDKKYHYNKTKLAFDNGYHCVNVWDWDDAELLIKTFCIPKERIYARKCDIKEVIQTDAITFINNNHLQGYAKDSIRLGLYYNNELVSIMTFDKPRYNHKYDYELVRYCSSKLIIGGADKLFKHFLDRYKPTSVISYCDRSKFNGDVYTELGFTAEKISVGKHWYNTNTKGHITDNLLRQRGFDQLFDTDYGKGTSNHDLMIQHGFVEVYDAGQQRYVYCI